MKPGQNVKQRARGRSLSNGNKRPPARNTTFDSNGPEIRVRGNAHQVLEKYLGMARDAAAQGDRISAENYYQHAEHYFRVINAQNQHHGNNRGYTRPMLTPADDQDMGQEAEENAAPKIAAEEIPEEAAQQALSA